MYITEPVNKRVTWQTTNDDEEFLTEILLENRFDTIHLSSILCRWCHYEGKCNFNIMNRGMKRRHKKYLMNGV